MAVAIDSRVGSGAGLSDVLSLRRPAYRVRLARTNEEQRAAYRLRFLVFNLELNEGLESAYQTGYDEDCFDAVCDHLIVEHAATGAVIGTYRLQTGVSAARHLGYYSEREFEFAPYERFRPQLLELGRACVHRDHRTFEVLTLLWRAVVEYAVEHGARYLVGCSSVTSQDPAFGAAMYRRLCDYQAEPRFRTRPTMPYWFDTADCGAHDIASVAPPKLLRAYLAIGAKICGAPALDRDFKTIDFLTLLDLQALPGSMRARLLPASRRNAR